MACVCMSDTLVCVILIPRSHMTPPPRPPLLWVVSQHTLCWVVYRDFPFPCACACVCVCVCVLLSLLSCLYWFLFFCTSRCTYRVLRELRVPKHNYQAIDAISTTVKNVDVKVCYVYLSNKFLPLNAHSKGCLLELQSTFLCVRLQVLYALKPPVVLLFSPLSCCSANFAAIQVYKDRPEKRGGIFPCHPVFPLDSPLLFPFLPHSSVSPPPLPSHPSSYLCWIFVFVTLESFTGSQGYIL